MYGLVNRSIEELVVGRFGSAAWERIREAAGVEEPVFLSNENYPDSITYRLVGAACQVLELSAAQVLEAFGEHWVMKTANDNYGGMLDMCGRTLPEFLRNLPHLHSRIILIFPALRPPEFTVSDETDQSIVIHYRTERDGLTHFVIGLLKGLGQRFCMPVTVTQISRRKVDSDCDSFRVEWPAQPAGAMAK